MQLVKKLKAEFASMRADIMKGKGSSEEPEFEVSDYFDIHMIKVRNTRPRGGLMEIGAIPNGRDKRDETGIDSDAMVSVSGVKQDFAKLYTSKLIADGMQLHGLGGKLCKPPK